MGWLEYNDDEVDSFHPEFISASNQVLKNLSLLDTHFWVHHDTSTEGGIPDYVLIEKMSGRYVLIVEIKKTSQAVHSLNYQYQAYNYARYNGHRYAVQRPHYTLLTNLEESILFAYRSEGHSPLDSRVLDQTYQHGSFFSDDGLTHRDSLV
jgi:hypothetical protein